MLIGYGRTSTVEQEAGLEAQIRDLTAAGCTKIFREQTSSVGRRDQLEAALDFSREGDVLIATRPCRLARSVADLMSIVDRLHAKGATLRVLSMGMSTDGPTGKLMLTLLGAIAAFERDLMLERQREGIAKAKRDGKYRGRAPTARRQAADIQRLRSEGLKPTEIAEKLGIGRASVYRIMQEVQPEAPR